tara:strand:+ start:252 stop:497 length:246 start_codon:yes stop_codon:yes gene_type:complete
MISKTRTFILSFALGVLISSCNYEYEPKKNKNLSPEIQDFDVCVKKQKIKGLSTDRCWDTLKIRSLEQGMKNPYSPMPTKK